MSEKMAALMRLNTASYATCRLFSGEDISAVLLMAAEGQFNVGAGPIAMTPSA
jgi:hypothetical protein